MKLKSEDKMLIAVIFLIAVMIYIEWTGEKYKKDDSPVFKVKQERYA
jgi:hypothetical protein